MANRIRTEHRPRTSVANGIGCVGQLHSLRKSLNIYIKFDRLSISIPAFLQEDDNENVSWVTTDAYSVDFNPAIGGEHVQAGFLVSVVSDEGDTSRTHYRESYYVVEGKIVHWRQWEMKINPPAEDE